MKPILTIQADGADRAALLSDYLARQGFSQLTISLNRANDLPDRRWLERVAAVVIQGSHGDGAPSTARREAPLVAWLRMVRMRGLPILALGGGVMSYRLALDAATPRYQDPRRAWLLPRLVAPAGEIEALDMTRHHAARLLVWRTHYAPPPAHAIPWLSVRGPNARTETLAYRIDGDLMLDFVPAPEPKLYERWLMLWRSQAFTANAAMQTLAELEYASDNLNGCRALNLALYEHWLSMLRGVKNAL